MRYDVSRGALLRGGEAALSSWVPERVVPDSETLLAEVRSRYWEAAAQVPWPPRVALRLHLVFSALPGAAVYSALRGRGWTRDRAVASVGEVIARRARRGHAQLARLTRLRAPRAAFLPLARVTTRIGFPSPGWEAQWRERSGRAVAFDLSRCYLLDTFTALGVPELTRAYCAADDLLYADLCPQLRWARAGTLATGAPVCDFRFERVESGHAH